MNNLFDISTPKKRERFLLIVAGILFVVIIIPVMYQLFGANTTRLRAERIRLKESIEKLENDVRQKDRIKKRLDELTEQSLPPGDALAQSLYQNWLIKTAEDVGLQGNQVAPGSVTPMKDHYRKFTMTLNSRGNLKQISEFLRVFHKTDYLHLVRKVTPRMTRNWDQMDVSITVEALTLPQAKTSQRLRNIPARAIAITDTERQTLRDITQRNLFVAWSPPPTPGPKDKEDDEPIIVAPNVFDHSPYCYIGSILEVDGKPQVWIDVRTEGKQFKLYEGDMFRLGGVRCFIKKIDFDNRKVDVEAAGGMYTIKSGNSFVEYE